MHFPMEKSCKIVTELGWKGKISVKIEMKLLNSKGVMYQIGCGTPAWM